MLKKLAQKGVILFIILLFYYDTSFALMKQVNLAYLVNTATSIYHGTVIDYECHWDKQRQNIFTTVQLSVLESIKEKSSNTPGIKYFIIPGGQVGEVGQKNSNSPIFHIDEKVIVFIKQGLTLVGEYQGKFQIQEKLVLERGLFIEDFLEEIKNTILDPSQGQFIPRVCNQSNYDYQVTKYRWCTQDPMGKAFYIYTNTDDVNDESSAIINAATSWNNCGACFQFSYGGLVTTSSPISANNNENIIFWNTRLGHPVLAQTTFWYNTTSGCINEIDCEFNDNEKWNTNGFDDFDIETCMLHEFGHYLCLEHSDNTDAIMYPYYQGTNRELGADDIAGIKAMYGDCTGGSNGTSWGSTYPLVVGSSENLALLKDYRDKILLSHPNGQYQVKCLYKQSEELLQILHSHPEILLKVRQLLDLNISEIKKALHNRKATLQDTPAIRSLLKDIASNSSLTTKFWLKSLEKKLQRCERSGKNFFGFQVDKDNR